MNCVLAETDASKHRIFVTAPPHISTALCDYLTTENVWQRRLLLDRTLDQPPAIATNRTNVNLWQWQ